MKSKLTKKLQFKRRASTAKITNNQSSVLHISLEPTDTLILLNVSCGGHKSCSYENLCEYFEIARYEALEILMKPDQAFTTIKFSSLEQSSKFKNLNDNRFIEEIDKHCFVEYANFKVNPDSCSEINNVEERHKLGFFSFPKFLDVSEEADLVKEIKKLSFEKVKDRYVIHYGYKFDYAINRLVDLENSKGQRWYPECMQSVLQKVRVKLGVKFDQITVSSYPVGTGIPSHVDSHCSFGNEIAILNLNSTVEFEFKDCLKNSSPINVAMDLGDLILIKDEIRYTWKHQIKERKCDVITRNTQSVVKERTHRYSLVFRTNKNVKNCLCGIPKVCDKNWKNDDHANK